MFDLDQFDLDKFDLDKFDFDFLTGVGLCPELGFLVNQDKLV